MDEALLEVRDYQGIGYQPLIDFGAWRVAILRYLDDIHPERNNSMERHTQTDEVFVLVQGQGMLILGGNDANVNEIDSQMLECGVIYNVKRNAWHTILLSRNAKVLLVENQDTGSHNSEYCQLSSEQQNLIRELAKRAAFD